MKTKVLTTDPFKTNYDTIVVAVFKNEKAKDSILQELDAVAEGLLASTIENEAFKGDIGETVFLHFTQSKAGNLRRVLLIGVGEVEAYKSHDAGVFAGTAARYLAKKNIKGCVIIPRCQADAGEVAACVMQAVVISQYEIDKYKTVDKKNNSFESFILFVEDAEEKRLKDGISRGQIIGDSMNFTRDLCNEPANILHPTEMADRAVKMAKEVSLKYEILDEAAMKKLGMGSLLSVSVGSEQPPKMIVLRYEPKKSSAKKGELIAIVGKGVCFDTGGISIKAAEGMDEMKYDMGGGAAVIGTMRAIGMLKPTVPVLGVVPAVENMVDGKATRPGDVVTAMTGKTIEILNTDAEGRLILADAVAYAEKEGATTIVDIATLTGAAIIALGNENTAVLGNDQDLVHQIIECGKEVGEGVWQLPVGAEYSKQIKSEIADIKNIIPGRKAGTIAGAVFIQEFIKEAKWAHLDIAGTIWLEREQPHLSKGPSAVPVKTLLRLVETLQ